MEHGTGNGHYQRGRNAFAADIAHGKMEHVALADKIVQVSSHLLGRYEQGVKLRRKVGVQHPHLDGAGHIEFRLHAFVVAPGGFQLADIIGNGVLHIDKTVPQAQHLVLAGDFGQLCLEISLAHIQGRHRKLRNGTRHQADFLPAQEIEDRQRHQAHNHQIQAQRQGDGNIRSMGNGIMDSKPDCQERDEENDGCYADNSPAQSV